MSSPQASAPAVSASKRRPALLALTALVVLAGIAYAVYWALVLNHFESTDNAYVQAPVVLVTPQLGGTVTAVLVDDTDVVKAGQTLVRMDPADAQLALDRAQSQLAQTVREVRTLFANNGALGANVQLRDAEIARAQSDVLRATEDLNRRRPLVATGAVGAEEMKHAETALVAAQSALAAARSARSAASETSGSNRALTDGTTVEEHPNVQRAAAAVREAVLALQRTELKSPTNGQIARRTVQVGQRIQAGAPLMTVIPLDRVWVEANFKEVQLRQMRIGQPVDLHADLYGTKVRYKGTIAGLGAGTGAAFALLPAQNATGNWIKVVQRVPVRIALDPAELAQHPLRVGLSMEASVDVADQQGQPLASREPARQPAAAAVAPGASSDASGASGADGGIAATVGQGTDVDRMVADIIAANGGASAKPTGKPVSHSSNGTAANGATAAPADGKLPAQGRLASAAGTSAR